MDEGGRSRLRAYRQAYYPRVSGVVFVVDSSDKESIDQAGPLLLEILAEKELQKKPLLVFANKRDLSNEITLDEIQDKLGLNELDSSYKWHLQPSSAIQGEGLQEGFKWLADNFVMKSDETNSIHETITDLTTIKQSFVSVWKKLDLKLLYKKFI